MIIRWLTSAALMGMGIRCGSCQEILLMNAL